MRKLYSIAAIIGVCAVGVYMWHIHESSSLTTKASKTTPDTPILKIPGDNLALGEDSSTELGTYLIGYDGRPVYVHDNDTVGSSTCYAECLDEWIPYVVTSTNLVAESPIAGIIGTTTRSDGSVQLTYNGQPLYFHTGDSKSRALQKSDTKNWHLAKP